MENHSILGKSFKSHYDESKPSFKSLKRIELFKALESSANAIFEQYIVSLFPQDTKKQEQYRAACFASNLAAFGEYSEEFYDAYQVVSKKQELVRQFIRFCLEDSEIESGWDVFDRALIIHSTKISTLYDPFYVAWSRAVQGNEVSKKLEDPEVAKSLDKSFLNGYTIIQLNDDGTFTQIPYAIHFSPFIQPIGDLFQHLIDQLEDIHKKGSSSLPQEVQTSYISYLKQYKTALLATNDLESVWEELDMKWMDVKHNIQIVHDIESGYGDPLRVKVIPDFSLRFIDETYAEANQTMSKIQDQMVTYFESRNTELSKLGLFSLSNCMSGIYCIPFQSGMSLHFRFSGQSIPNRTTVKEAKGVKLYFDPVSTGLRQESTKKLLQKVFNPQQHSKLSSTLDSVETIVYHVSAHEVGHSIYNLKSLEDLLHPSTPALLEEPRAELTSLFTMNLLYKNKFISLEHLQRVLTSFMLQDLRRYSMFDSAATRPYTISAMHTYNLYLRNQFLVWDRAQNYLSVDDSKATSVLEELSSLFLEVLKAEDEKNAQRLEQILQDMQTETDLTKWLVTNLKSSN